MILNAWNYGHIMSTECLTKCQSFMIIEIGVYEIYTFETCLISQPCCLMCKVHKMLRSRYWTFLKLVYFKNALTNQLDTDWHFHAFSCDYVYQIWGSWPRLFIGYRCSPCCMLQIRNVKVWHVLTTALQRNIHVICLLLDLLPIEVSVSKGCILWLTIKCGIWTCASAVELRVTSREWVDVAI